MSLPLSHTFYEVLRARTRLVYEYEARRARQMEFLSDGGNGDEDGFVNQQADLASALSPEAFAALMEFSREKGIIDYSSSDEEDEEHVEENEKVEKADVLSRVRDHFHRSKIGDKNKDYAFTFAEGRINFTLKGVKQELGQTLDSTGLTIWRAAEHLCEYIENNASLFEDKVVCELGCGLGLVSILLDKMTICKQVIATDGDDVSLKLLRENIEATRCTETLVVDKLMWGDHDEFIGTYSKVDVIVAADVIYEDHHVDLLMSTAAAILKDKDGAFRDNAMMILAYARRQIPLDRVLEAIETNGLTYTIVEGDLEPIIKIMQGN